MPVPPKKYQSLKKLLFYLSALLIISLTLIGYLTFKIINLRRAPPFLPVGSLKTKTINLPCRQITNDSGFEIKNKEVKTFPRCLTVMNSRFGSRFNFDWYFGEQKVRSSVMGTLEAEDIGLVLEWQNGEEIGRIFPLAPNSSFSVQTNELGLTYQKTSFESDNLVISLIIRSPFLPSNSINDEALKISSAPFFYLEFDGYLKNPSSNFSHPESIRISLNSAGEIKNNRLYFPDLSRRDGLRALASLNNKARAFIENGRGGFVIPLNFITSSTLPKPTLIYAGWLSGGVITDSSRLENKKISQFKYVNLFQNIDDVIDFSVSKYNLIYQNVSLFEENFKESNLSPEQKWLAAQAFHSYIGNTFLVNFSQQKDSWQFFVWEGEFKYLNTLDVAHDYDVLAGLFFPWVIKSELLNWADSVKSDQFGKVIPHDLGFRFELKKRQEYAIPGAESSGMPVEENADFILLSWWYYNQTKDLNTLKFLSPLIIELCDSLIARDSNQNGIADRGIGMTTYDNDGNLKLKQGSDSHYLAVKQLAAYLAAEKIFELTDNLQTKEKVNQQAELIVFKDGPKVIKENPSFVWLTPLFYLVLTSLNSPILNKFIPELKENYPQAWQKSLLKTNGKSFGLQLAEKQTLNLGWFSHSVMADFIAQKLFKQNYDSDKIFFPLLYDNPYAFADGQYFRQPGQPKTTLLFYPRGAVIFAFLYSF